jgi:hypothetical protein
LRLLLKFYTLGKAGLFVKNHRVFSCRIVQGMIRMPSKVRHTILFRIVVSGALSEIGKAAVLVYAQGLRRDGIFSIGGSLRL